MGRGEGGVDHGIGRRDLSWPGHTAGDLGFLNQVSKLTAERIRSVSGLPR
jgi:hypothetical protein